MKMTIEIPSDVLSELMQLTGLQTKRQAVEFALRDAAQRARRRRVWRAGLGLTPDQLAADAAAQTGDAADAPDIDADAVTRALAAADQRSQRRAQMQTTGFQANETAGSYDTTP